MPPNQLPDDELELYKQVNQELRRFYDYLVKSFEHLKNKALAILVGEVAIVTFLFQGFSLGTDKHRVPIYGIVVFGLGLALLAYSYLMFLIVISRAKWQFPTEEHDMKKPTASFNNSPLEYQKYLHSEYMSKVSYCNQKIEYRSLKFMHGIYSLSAGIFLIILVKYGGGA